MQDQHVLRPTYQAKPSNVRFHIQWVARTGCGGSRISSYYKRPLYDRCPAARTCNPLYELAQSPCLQDFAEGKDTNRLRKVIAVSGVDHMKIVILCRDGNAVSKTRSK